MFLCLLPFGLYAIYIEAEGEFVMSSWVGAAKGGRPTDSSTIKQEMRPLWAEYLRKRYEGLS